MYVLMCWASLDCICLIKSLDELDQRQSITHLCGNEVKNGEIVRQKNMAEITDTAFSTQHCQH